MGFGAGDTARFPPPFLHRVIVCRPECSSSCGECVSAPRMQLRVVEFRINLVDFRFQRPSLGVDTEHPPYPVSDLLNRFRLRQRFFQLGAEFVERAVGPNPQPVSDGRHVLLLWAEVGSGCAPAEVLECFAERDGDGGEDGVVEVVSPPVVGRYCGVDGCVLFGGGGWCEGSAVGHGAGCAAALPSARVPGCGHCCTAVLPYCHPYQGVV